MTPTRDGVDYSFSRANVAQLRAAGILVVERYLSHTPAKNLTVGEAAELHGAGIGILLGWESSAGRALEGAVAGSEDGRDAASQAQGLGAPLGLSIYFAVDEQAPRSHWDAVVLYLRAAGAAMSGRYKVGVYADADLIDYLHGQGVVTSEWQTYAWSNGRLSQFADFYQYLNGQTLAGASVDFDEIVHAGNLGAWWPNGVVVPQVNNEVPIVTTPDTTDWFDMATVQDLNNVVVGVFRSTEGQKIIHDACALAIRELAAPNAELYGRIEQAVNDGSVGQVLTALTDPARGVVVTQAQILAAVKSIVIAPTVSQTVDNVAIAKAVRQQFAIDALAGTVTVK